MNLVSLLARDKLRFGTDGWRGIIGRNFTLRNVERITQAYADYLIQKNGHNLNNKLVADSFQIPAAVVVGYDHRRLSSEAAAKAVAVLAGNRIPVLRFDEPIPTPVVSWSVKRTHAAGGIIITASHNPPEYNGLKIKSPEGRSAPQEITESIESFVDKNPIKFRLDSKNSREMLRECTESYRQQIENLVDLERIRKSKASVIIDSMHGTGGGWIESFLKNGRLSVETIRAEADTNFGGTNPEPIERNLGELQSKVKQSNSLIGLATDGDADRFGAVNEKGETMTMHQIVPLLLLHLLKNKKMTGSIVSTFSQSVLIRRIAEAFGMNYQETPIGFKYIAELMLENNVLLGAEESGGVGIKGHLPERDGILNNLLFLESVVFSAQTPSGMINRLQREFGAFYYGRSDMTLNPECGNELIERLSRNPPERLAREKIVGVKTLDGLKFIFKDESWILFRQSGTEPLLRIYCEAASNEKKRALLIAAHKLISRSK